MKTFLRVSSQLSDHQKLRNEWEPRRGGVSGESFRRVKREHGELVKKRALGFFGLRKTTKDTKF